MDAPGVAARERNPLQRQPDSALHDCRRGIVVMPALDNCVVAEGATIRRLLLLTSGDLEEKCRPPTAAATR